jgi:hypothetical protein
MTIQAKPKYQPKDNVVHNSGSILIIIKLNEWIANENTWSYVAMSVRTESKVYVRENELHPYG